MRTSISFGTNIFFKDDKVSGRFSRNIDDDQIPAFISETQLQNNDVNQAMIHWSGSTKNERSKTGINRFSF